MNAQEFSRLVSEKRIPPVLFFQGPEEYLKEAALAELRRALLPEGLEELNETRLTGPDTEEIIAAAETLPFMADRRLVLLRDFPAVTGRGEADEKLLSYLPQAPASAVILFYCVQPVKQKKIKNLVQKLGGLVDFSPLSDQELSSFVTRFFHELGRKCDARTADFLVFTVGRDLHQLRTEIAKIAAYHPEQPTVDPADVQALATPSTESRIFTMVDAVVAGQADKAFLSLRNLLANGENPVMILSMLLRQYRLLQQVKILQFEKKPAGQIPTAMGLNGWVASQYQRQAGTYNGQQVREAVALCLDTDLKVKSGLLRQDSALEGLMLRLLLLRNPETNVTDFR